MLLEPAIEAPERDDWRDLILEGHWGSSCQVNRGLIDFT